MKIYLANDVIEICHRYRYIYIETTKHNSTKWAAYNWYHQSSEYGGKYGGGGGGGGEGGFFSYLRLYLHLRVHQEIGLDLWKKMRRRNKKKKEKKKFARDLSFNGHKTIITLTSVEYCKLRIVQLDGVMALLQTTEKLMKWIEVGVAISFSLVVLTFYI